MLLDTLYYEADRRNGLPLGTTKAIANTEGSGDSAVSTKGARGHMQFMPATGKRYGLLTEEDFNNPAKSIAAGGRYLGDLYRMFGGNLSLTAAGYNAGEGAVKTYGKIPPYRETQAYVPKFLKAFEKYSVGQTTAPDIKVAVAETGDAMNPFDYIGLLSTMKKTNVTPTNGIIGQLMNGIGNQGQVTGGVGSDGIPELLRRPAEQGMPLPSQEQQNLPPGYGDFSHAQAGLAAMQNEMPYRDVYGNSRNSLSGLMAMILANERRA